MEYIGVKKIKQRLEITSKKLKSKGKKESKTFGDNKWDRETSIKELTAMLEDSKKKKDLKSTLAIIKELNVLQGNDPEDKVTKVTVVIGGTSNTPTESSEVREERVRNHLIKEGMLK